ncbi:syntaxin-6-like [Halichondria panicea]|uniref:syntaxin-6-like n=1 Tax=Halichondria panicea TaxID=6063 RepID=UPI00312B4089
MSLEDPFFVVRDEVRQSMNNAQSQYSQWSMLLDSEADIDKVQGVATELKNCIKSIEWDLEDLEQTIKIAEANPHKFRLDYGELETRKQFIRDTRSVMKRMKDHLSSDQVKAKLEQLKRKSLLHTAREKKPRGRYARLEEEMERSNQDFIEGQRNQQQMVIARQDDRLDQVGASVSTLKRIGETIGDELDDQQVMLEDFDREIEHTDSRMRSLTSRVNKAIKQSGSKCQLCTIVILVVVLLIVIAFFFIPF